jgi:Holliday junction resolvase RusA-like endonuclease
MIIRKKIKPLSVNECWQGQRFKTNAYKIYEKELLLTLPALTLPPAPYSIYFEFGFSNIASDYDNPVKPLQDILQKKYGFNDKDIYEARILKKKVAKGHEYFIFKIETTFLTLI